MGNKTMYYNVKLRRVVT